MPIEYKNLARDLDYTEMEFRVGSTQYYNKKGYAMLLAYKDARVDMKILDEVCGPENWQVEYVRDSKGILQCRIGIYNAELKQWVWKASNGVESNTEQIKGEYSDAFKRAGFMWGIGRQLYDFPQIKCELTEKEFTLDGKDKFGNDKIKVAGFFKPNTWTWIVDIKEGKVHAIDTRGDTRVDVKPK